MRPAAVGSYDPLISVIFIALGFRVAGPLADVIRLHTTLLLAMAVSPGVAALSLQNTRQPRPAAAPGPAPT